MHSLPTHVHVQVQARTTSLWSVQSHTLTKLSSEDLRAAKASATVAERESGFKAGFPRQRSDTSCDSKLTAMQYGSSGEVVAAAVTAVAEGGGGGGGGGERREGVM